MSIFFRFTQFFSAAVLVRFAISIMGYLTSLFLTSQKGFPKKKESLYLVKGANLLGLGVMTGALFSEFLLRVNPKWPLVYIASAIVIFSALNLYKLRDTRVLTPA